MYGAAAVVALFAVGATAGRARTADAASCTPRAATAAYTSSVKQAVASGHDLWGARLLHARGGPTYAAARNFLTPLTQGDAVAGSAADHERLLLHPVVLPVHLVRIDGLRLACGGRKRDRHQARRRPVALRVRRLRQRALRIVPRTPAARPARARGTYRSCRRRTRRRRRPLSAGVVRRPRLRRLRGALRDQLRAPRRRRARGVDRRDRPARALAAARAHRSRPPGRSAARRG